MICGKCMIIGSIDRFTNPTKYVIYSIPSSNSINEMAHFLWSVLISSINSSKTCWYRRHFWVKPPQECHLNNVFLLNIVYYYLVVMKKYMHFFNEFHDFAKQPNAYNK